MNGMLIGFGLLAVVVVLLAVLWIVLKALHNVQLELRGVNERVSGMEHNQARVDQGIGDLRTGLAKTDSATARLMSATTVIHDQLVRAKEGVAQLQTHSHARQGLEEQTAESIKRLEAVIAGTQSKGAAGENILETLLAHLPAEWQVRDFQVGNKSVEFGLRLPNRLVLPIDSKWPATHLIETFLATDDPDERQRVKSRIESAVRDKAKEVRKVPRPERDREFRHRRGARRGLRVVHPRADRRLPVERRADQLQHGRAVSADGVSDRAAVGADGRYPKAGRLPAQHRRRHRGHAGRAGRAFFPRADDDRQLPQRAACAPRQGRRWPHQPADRRARHGP